MNNNFLRIDELAKELCISKTTLWRMRVAGKLPKPISLSKRIVVWRRSSIDEWLNEQSLILPY